MTEKAKTKNKAKLTGIRISECWRNAGQLKGKVEFSDEEFEFALNIGNDLCNQIIALIPDQIRAAKSLLADKLEELATE